MDSKGYIPISLLASFNRIKQLTLDTRLVKEVLLLSAFVEVNGGMVRMGGAASSNPSGGGNESQQIRSSSSWESFVLPDAVESVVEDAAMENVVVDNSYGGGGGGGYHPHQQQQQLNGYAYGGGAGYGYGYGAAGYGYGYGYGYPPVGPTAGLGYYEDPQNQQQQQASGGGGYEPGEGVVVEHEHTSSETVPSSMLMNGHTAESTMTKTRKLDDRPPSTSALLSKEDIKPNGIFKHDQQHGEECNGEEEEEEEEDEEDVVFVMGGTDVSTSWTPERRA